MRTDHVATDEIGPMSAADIPRGMDLVRMAGWNQTEDDWTTMLRLGQGYGVRRDDGMLVASSIVMPYAPGIAWIGMVLVDEAMRRRGLATRLLDNAIARIRQQALVPMLDATPAGREVYRALGFVDMAPIGRWRGAGTGTGGFEPAGPPIDVDAIVALDTAAFGASRRSLLLDFSARRNAVTLTLPEGRGALWSRAGRTATQIGPVVAARDDDALALCAEALDHIAGPVLLDVPDRETALTAMLIARGFTKERPFSRMALGTPPSSTLGTAMRVIAGPEIG